VGDITLLAETGLCTNPRQFWNVNRLGISFPPSMQETGTEIVLMEIRRNQTNSALFLVCNCILSVKFLYFYRVFYRVNREYYAVRCLVLVLVTPPRDHERVSCPHGSIVSALSALPRIAAPIGAFSISRWYP
jgi:hypothetical protein